MPGPVLLLDPMRQTEDCPYIYHFKPLCVLSYLHCNKAMLIQWMPGVDSAQHDNTRDTRHCIVGSVVPKF